YVENLQRALAAYHFTDATSDLLARWLDALADLPRSRGTARALAGLRGVGKSHTLAVFAALASMPELRTAGVSDAHVATSARRLLNRRYLLARVERGTRASLLEEVGVALASAFGGAEADWFNVAPQQMLAVAASRAGDTPLVLLIDTAFGREARVKRDDGPALSQLAAATESAHVFIALALDDDIEGAEGVNAVLAGTYQIDYLDPEHLYRIADLHLFQKNPQARLALHDIYNSLRTVVPGFNWSEPRFTAIYPVHPLIADVASAVRLYAPHFAFLPFAAQSVERATNRPALSLIVLDEVFDRTEEELRRAVDLEKAFAVYDQLSSDIASQIPIMQRLHARLLLKGLFILSLDGRGATARELGAAMLIYDEGDAEAGISRIEELLARFAELSPEGGVRRADEAQAEPRYRFNISTADAFEEALAQAIENIAPDSSLMKELLRGLPRSRFPDWPLGETDEPAAKAKDFTLMWRGMGRLGRINWQQDDERGASEAATKATAADGLFYDWKMTVEVPDSFSVEGRERAAALHAPDAPISITWRPSSLKPEELEHLRRLIALRTDASLLSEFGEAARAAERTHTGLAERIWIRAFMDDGALLWEETAHAFTDEALAGHTLSGVLERMLHPLFEARYPEHPVFTQALTEAEVSRLVGGFFGGASQSEMSVQELARRYCAPLGLASQRSDAYVLEAGDAVLKQPWIREVLRMTDEADGSVVPLDSVYALLRSEPYGLQREAQHLIFAALVAQRRIELVTATGDRIGRRTLDLKLRWDELSGVARAAALLHGADELTGWARRLTGSAELASIADPQARGVVRGALRAWLEDWRSRRVLEKFQALPDEGLTTRAWNLSASVRKSFGVAADAIEAALDDTISLEEGLQRVADAFADSEENFRRSTKQLASLSNFTSGLEGRVRAHDYLMLSEPTGQSEIESARRELLRIAEDVHNLFDQESCLRFDLLWREFRVRYLEHYASVHDETVGASVDRRSLDEFLRSSRWREFEALSALSITNTRYRDEAARVVEEARGLSCTLPVRKILMNRPSCDCSFRLVRATSLKHLSQELRETVEAALETTRQTLRLMSGPLSAALGRLGQSAQAEEERAGARALSEAFARGSLPETFSQRDVRLIEEALKFGALSTPVRVQRPPVEAYGLVTREDLRARLNQWLDELPDQPAMVEVTGDHTFSENNGD
ncbi:MAG TPA: hypothetical protein VJS44_00825, partial [Pyrinomonadaceae bacterium]|nr:hypothetical protein [Pyrinomonadaceae bacterium]